MSTSNNRDDLLLDNLIEHNRGGTPTEKPLHPDSFSPDEWEQLKKETWFQTFTGRRFHAFDPQPEDIHIQDIAHALSLINRYNGMTKFPYSVAQHSILVAGQVEDKYKLEALMHDASEAYIMDVPRPWKPFFVNYKEAENLLMSCIADKFNFKWPLPDVIHTVDNKLLHTEAIQLLPGVEWANYKHAYKNMPIQERNWRDVEHTFHMLFGQLYYARVA